ncbi:folylpolyglutamate synthase/dihydrofolate synthase family protein [Roseisolibacter sp. H3M3-2]|uniref:bifunctional folylpolyglutamate synthase/dihydrofolate synthase n=1 Tax=Roseisolibacter sp. H3M3-2 TaxID=3031323 RepID=UPI0023DA8C30|nr:folylpolyglutamate synthase/dihydrofolate synthase family protein [Roseisolibacter sp. H3M3-2]MDF1501507.1 bifunctional folylpolyglutamate synthase/dihydrofolate synthase [Roseisolibacter sp. H3M3-2]
MRALLAALGDPHLAVPVFHVAGTNGKGSTVATLEALLRAGGHRVARFTSPHLVDFRERIVVGGAPIAEAEVEAWVARWLPTADALGATFFEITTALAFDHFARAGADVAVVETGLGGRLDSTNVVRPLVAGVTAIGLDHTDLLGDTREAIAAEKGGIFKAGAAAVVGEPDPAIRAALAAQARAAGAGPVRVVAEECTVSDVALTAGGTAFALDAPFGRARLVTPLLGAYQAHNAATALTMLDAAGDPWWMPIDRVAAALGEVRLAGRFQRVGRWLFDVAHNPDGARVLGQTLGALAPERPVVALVTVLSDKDWRGMLRALAPAVDHLVLSVAPTAPPGRVWPLAAAAAFAAEQGWDAVAEPDFDRALALASARGRTVLVTGSFHTVGDAMLRLQVDPLAR